MISTDEQIKELYRRFKYGRDLRDSYRRPEWEKISKFLSPAHGRFMDTRDNIPAKGKVDRSSILNNSASRNMAIAVAGIKGGLVPHSLKWFKLGLYDEDLEAWDPVRDWLGSCEKVMYSVFNRSNFYEAAYLPFHEQMAFGTGPFQIDEHPTGIIHCDPWTCGEYVLMSGADKMVDTGFRERWFTLRALEQKFGKEKLSSRSQNMLKNNPDQFIKVIQCIMPREDYDMHKRDNLNMPVASVWFEEKGNEEKILGESGFRATPMMYPRWITIGEDPYGSDCPGMSTLPDIMMLQQLERDALLMLALQGKPPMNVPSSTQGRLSLYPGAMNKIAERNTGKVERTFDFQFDLNAIEAKIQNVEERIGDGFYNDLFLMLLNSERSGTTAYEIAKKNEEKLVLLGPVVERQNNEFLTPAIDRTFEICMAKGMFPPVPEELIRDAESRGEDSLNIRTEYVSLLAQAQKAVGIQGIERTLGTISGLAEMFPEILHKIDAMRVVDEVADLQGMNPKLIRSSDEAMKRFDAERQAMQQAQQAQQMVDMSGAAKNLAQAPLADGDSALDRVMSQLPAI